METEDGMRHDRGTIGDRAAKICAVPFLGNLRSIWMSVRDT
jgi:hypothetical protein